MKPSVSNEWGKLNSVLVHRGDNAMDHSMEFWQQAVKPENLARHPEYGVVVAKELQNQVGAFRGLLLRNGVSLHIPESQPHALCQVFTRDPCFVVNDVLFIGSMGERYRDSEIQGLDLLRSRVEKVVDLRGEGRIIEGGDVFVMDEGETVLVGNGEITNEAGTEALFEALWKHTKVNNMRIIYHDALHLDCCFAPLPDGDALYAEDKLSLMSRSNIPNVNKFIPLDETEAHMGLAANLFWMSPKDVVSNTQVPKTNAFLHERGYNVHELPFDQLVHEWGSTRCTVCPLVRD